MATNGRWPKFLAVCALILVAASCGSDAAPVDLGADPEPEPSRTWEHQVLAGESGPDQPDLLASEGDDVVIVMTSEDGTITGYSSIGGGPFESGPPAASGVAYLRLGGVARLGEQWITLGSGGIAEVDGDEQQMFSAHGFASPDGRTWTELDVTGMDAPADVSALVEADGSVVAVGALRDESDPGRGGFRAVSWHSGDGKSWTQIALPGSEQGESFASDVVVVNDTVVAAGRVESGARLWASRDSGRTWETVEPTGIPADATISSMQVIGGEIVASATTAGAPMLLRSGDGGVTWAEAIEPPPGGEDEHIPPSLTGGGGRLFATVSSFRDAWSEPALCYADIGLCRQDSSVALYASEDGDRWTRIDTSGLGEGEASEVDTVVGAEDGRIVALHWSEEGRTLSVWPAGADLPTAPEPVDPTSSVVLLGEDEEPEIGVTYGVPLYIHCGMDWLFLGGEPWKRTDTGPDAETGAGEQPPAEWPVAQQIIFGFATRVSEDVVEYSIDGGEVIATYAPADEQPSACM